VQQIGSPDELYRRPVNLFVAGFIGSPAMNFFPAALTEIGLRLPFGEIPLTGQVYDRLTGHRNLDDLIAGIRPEHLEDAAVIDAYARIRSLVFDVTVEMVESLGADKYVYFGVDGPAAEAVQLAEVAAESAVGENEFVARVPVHSAAAVDRTLALALDPDNVMIFDPRTGANLSVAMADA
jgi:multiple sugar transport system ATP-binding protein